MYVIQWIDHSRVYNSWVSIFRGITKTVQLNRLDVTFLWKVIMRDKFAIERREVSSQSIRNSHTLCNRIFILIIVGENQPSTSNTLAMFKTRTFLVICEQEESSGIVSWRVSVTVFHSKPRVLVYASINNSNTSDIAWTLSLSSRLCGMCSSTWLLFEFHFLSRNLPHVNRSHSCL